MLSEFRTLTSAIVQGTLSASDVIYAPGGNSDQWNLNGGGDLSIIQSSSANWESTYTTVSSNSATWGTGGSVYDDSLLQAASGDWNSTYTTVSANSANWVKYDIEDITTPATWVLDEDNLSSDSDTKVPTQQSVKKYVDDIVTGINNLKGGYNASTDQPAISAGIGVQQGDAYWVETGGLFYTEQVDPGDLIIATEPGANTEAKWVIVNRNIDDQLIDRWNSTYTTTSANSANWDSNYNWTNSQSASWIGGDYDDSLLQAASGDWDSTYTTVSSNSASWGIDTDTIYDDSLLQSASGDWDSTYTTVSSNSASWGIDTVYDDSLLQSTSGTWDSTYTTVSSNSAAWGIDTVYDDSLLQSTSGTWDSTYTTVSSNSAAWGSAGSGDFCSTTVLLNEVSACGGTMSVDGLLSASDMTTTTLTADGIYFNTGANRPPELGELVWDETEKTLDLGLENGVVLQVGEEQLINVQASEEIKDGQVVYASGAFSQGNTSRIVVSLYSASSAEGIDIGATDELFFLGIATQDIAQNTSGYITTFGKVRNINVYDGSNVNSDIVGPDNVGGAGNDPDWPVGKTLYVSTSAGRLTNTPPESPNKTIPTAMVISQSGNGHQRTLFVRQEHGYHIDELHDVRVINPQQNDVLAYNSTLESWDNVTSNNWESTFTTVSSNSADWVTYSTDNISSANWVLDEDNLVSDSAIKVPTQQSVKAYVDGIVTGINSLKGGYDVSTDTPAITAGIGVLQGDSYYVTVSGSFYGQQTADPGDLIIATTDSANLSSEWIVVNRNIQDELIDRWNSTYTTVSTQSADWADHFDSSLIASTSGDWNSTYTTVNTESADWDSTYTTVDELSASWSEGASTGVVFDTSQGTTQNHASLKVKDTNTGYSDTDGFPIGNTRGAHAVDLQIYRSGADQVAAGISSIIAGGQFNKIEGSNSNGSYGAILGGDSNEILQSQHGVILGGTQNKINPTSGNANFATVAGQSAHAKHGKSFIWNDTVTLFETKQTNTFNIHANNGLRLVFDTAPEVGQVLTCYDTDGHSKWSSLSADEWNSTYTTVSANSGIWDNSAALAYNDGATNSIEIGLLDSTTETGPRAISIQSTRFPTQPDMVASGEDAIAIGSYTKASGNGSIAIGSQADAQLTDSLAVGKGAWATAAQSCAFGPSSRATGGNAIAIGFSVQATGAESMALGWTCQAKKTNSYAIGRRVINDTVGTLEIGYWTPDAGATRKGSIRMDDQKNVSFSVRTSQLALTDGGTTNGAEAVGTLGRAMFAFRRNGDDFYIDANDTAGNITTVQVNNDDTFLQAASGNWDSTYTTVSSNSATWSNSQQAITSSAGTLTLDVSLGQSATTTLTEDITTFTIQNASAGDSGILIISSDGGGWTFPDQNSLGASHIIHTGSSDSISTLTSTTSSAVSIGWYCDGSRQFLYISDPT